MALEGFHPHDVFSACRFWLFSVRCAVGTLPGQMGGVVERLQQRIGVALSDKIRSPSGSFAVR